MMALAPETLQCIPARFESGPDRHFASGLQNASGGTQTLFMEFRIAHATAVAKNVDCTFCRFVGGAPMGPEYTDDGVQLSIIQFGTARCGPGLGFVVFQIQVEPSPRTAHLGASVKARRVASRNARSARSDRWRLVSNVAALSMAAE